MRRLICKIPPGALCGFVLLSLCGAAASEQINRVLFGLMVVLLVAKIGGDLAVRVGQPEVLGELIVGVVLGNLTLVGINAFEFLKHAQGLHILAELGVILLLFEVGLEGSVKEMLSVGISSFLAAILGVVVPFVLGWWVSSIFVPDAHHLVHVFVGATLTATSVGITARVLRDLDKIRTPEGKIVLGAAVIDDVLGLVVLAVVAGIISAANRGGELELTAVAAIIGKSVGFLAAALLFGGRISIFTFKMATVLRSRGILLAVSLAICFGMAYLASLVGLAPIVGAFTAGLVLEPVHYQGLHGEHEEIDHLIAPITAMLVPIFFVSMGANVVLAEFAKVEILAFAACLTVAAVVGKQVCGLGVVTKGVDRVAVGLGMIPRGEVGLIFAGIGATLMLDGEPVIDAATFGAVIIMVIVTTMVTPPLIKWRFSHPRHAAQ